MDPEGFRTLGGDFLCLTMPVHCHVKNTKNSLEPIYSAAKPPSWGLASTLRNLVAIGNSGTRFSGYRMSWDSSCAESMW